MLSRFQVEARVLAAYDATRKGKHVEDSLVELKRDWPDPAKAARRIAGHANAARGEAVLWLIGLDENEGVVSLPNVDIAQWWSQTESCFEGNAPGMTDFIVRTEAGPIHVLQFDSAPGPFVVRNPAYGKPGAGHVEREVPWRSGTSVRSATREDLIRMLAPMQPLPSIELLAATLTLTSSPPRDGHLGEEYLPVEMEPHLVWSVRLEMYVAPQVGSISVLPVHQTRVNLTVGECAVIPAAEDRARYSRPSFWGGASGSRPDSVSVDTTSSEAVVHLPGRLYYSLRMLETEREVTAASLARIRFSVVPVYTEHAVQLDAVLETGESTESTKMAWRLRRPARTSH